MSLLEYKEMHFHSDLIEMVICKISIYIYKSNVPPHVSHHKHNCDKFVYDLQPDFSIVQLENYLKLHANAISFAIFYYY